MERMRARRFGVKAGVRVLAALIAALLCVSKTSTAAEPVAAPEAPAMIDLPATGDLPGVVIFPSRAAGARPITVVLHGMCGEPSRTCSHFAEQVTETANLVCPRASQRCSGGGASWPQAGFAEAVEAAVARAKTALPVAADDEHGRTLIGYSLGAYRAIDIAESTPGKYPRVMLIGAKVMLDQKRLNENGVLRVLLSAGGWDMMHDPMQREAARALQTGIRARFLDLGPVGHTFTASFARYLPDALAWLGEG